MSLKDITSPFYVWQRAFKKPFTAMGPITERAGAPAYRGFHINDIEKCVGCGSCQTICQNRAIDMVEVGRTVTKGDSGLRPRFDYGRCCWCALCIDICTTASLRMTNEYVWVSDDADSFRFTPGVDKISWEDKTQGYRRANGYGLLNLARQPMAMVPAKEAVKSFEEVVKGYSLEQAQLEADRCVECQICIATCPAHMDIPNYIKAIRQNNLEEGLRILYKTNPFSASCGRICTRRCETSCTIGSLGEPIAIRWLKRYIVDQIPATEFKRILNDEITENGQRVAIIGAGPGGLSAAYYLRKRGYQVVVFEAKQKAGGMLRYGVPAYRLPDDQLDKDCDYIISLGIEVKYNTRVGKDITFETLVEEYAAVFVGIGLNLPSSMRVEGENHPRVIPGLKVLDDVANHQDPGIGDNVVVIGGGNVAMDAARAARRLGTKVTVLYRRRIEDMPADPEEIHEAREDGCTFVTQAIPVAIKAAATENLVDITWGEAEMVSDDQGGRPRPVLQEDKMHTATFSAVISAIGQIGDMGFIPVAMLNQMEIKRNKFSAGQWQQTALSKVFVGGDVANFTADVISAIADGQRAAIGIDNYLKKLQPAKR